MTETFRAELTEAVRARDSFRRDTLRLIIAAVDNARIAAQHELTDEEVLRVLRREARQRRDSIEEYQRGNRPDLVAQEQAELEFIEQYLPAALSDDELRTAAAAVVAEVQASGPGDIGKVMGPLLKRLGDRADGRRANEVVREILAGR
ncbi:MAG: GatB/YqeY domain-containing protein [Dehalococcoidia bacterium]|nr:GatB/YqeY domain-containing protein [Dehalococcoidia bacterium]